MKKTWLALTCVLLMMAVLLLGAAAAAEEKVYKLGESIELENAKITPSFTGFADKLANWPDKKFMTPDGDFVGDTPFEGKGDWVMMYGEIKIDYFGQEKSDVTIDLSMSVNYDDGYIYDNPYLYRKTTKDDWDKAQSVTFVPLSSDTSRLLRYALRVSRQIEKNSSKSLLCTFTINGQDYVYDFRSGKVRTSDYDPRAEFYKPAKDKVQKEVIKKLKANKVKLYGYYGTTFGDFTFTFKDKKVTAKLPINKNKAYTFNGTYKVYAKTILIAWDYGQEMHIDYTYDGKKLKMGTPTYGR